MKEFKILGFLDKFKSFFKAIGIDYEAMRKILQVKLIMDGRRTATVTQNNNKDEKKDKNNFFRSLWVYSLMGIIFIPFVVIDISYIYQMSIIFGMFMFIVLITMISDFSSVLLDIRDKNIIATKPVNSRTIAMAKTIHILIYMVSLTGAFVGPSLVVSLVKQGPVFFVLYLIGIIFMDILIIAITSLLYLLVLKFFDGEKLKDIINYTQIILSILSVISYQFVGRIFSIVDLNITFNFRWWQYLLPPVWFGAPFEILIKGNMNSYFVIFSILAVVVPIIAISLYVRLTPVYERNLQKLNNNEGSKGKKKSHISNFIAKVVCPNKQERTFYNYSIDMMKSERNLKLKIYPTLGFSIIMPFIFLFTSGLEGLYNSKGYLYIYFSGMYIVNIGILMKYSDNHKGAWIYKLSPIKNLGPIFRGNLKAIIVRLILPLIVFQSVVFMFILGPRILPDLVFIFINFTLLQTISFLALPKVLPFTEPFNSANNSEGCVSMIGFGALLGALAFIHYILTKFTYGIYGGIGAGVIILLLLWKTQFNIMWEKLNAE